MEFVNCYGAAMPGFPADQVIGKNARTCSMTKRQHDRWRDYSGYLRWEMQSAAGNPCRFPGLPGRFDHHLMPIMDAGVHYD